MRFTKGVRTSNVTNSNAAVEILAGIKGARLLSCYVTTVTAVAGVLGIGRPAAAGVTPTTPLTFPTVEGVGDASLARTALAWGTSPTDPTIFYSRTSLSATIGSAANIVFPYGIWIPASTTLVLQNILGGPTYDITIEISE